MIGLALILALSTPGLAAGGPSLSSAQASKTQQPTAAAPTTSGEAQEPIKPETWPVLTPADDPFMVAMPGEAEVKRDEDTDGTVRRVYATRTEDGQAFVVVSTTPPPQHLATVRALSIEQMFKLATDGIVSNIEDEGNKATVKLERTMPLGKGEAAEGTIAVVGKPESYRARVVRVKDQYFFMLVTMPEVAKAKERADRFFETFQPR